MIFALFHHNRDAANKKEGIMMMLMSVTALCHVSGRKGCSELAATLSVLLSIITPFTRSTIRYTNFCRPFLSFVELKQLIINTTNQLSTTTN